MTTAGATPAGSWATRHDPPRPGHVTAPHVVVYPDPIRVTAGAPLHVGRRDDGFPRWLWCRAADGREGWVPDVLVDVDSSNPGHARARHAYDARELAVEVGALVLVVATFDGWHWVEADGKAGWIPESCATVDTSV